MQATWSFRKMAKGEPAVNPIQGEFFNSESLDSPSDALVRESIQNSLDAGRTDEKVRVRIMFSSPHEALTAEEAAPYLSLLTTHVNATDSGLTGVPSTQERMPFLVIEDFGTRGLAGDPAQHDDNISGKNDFYYFWRNVGRTGKTDGQRGTWGLGKSVFPNSSRINSFFGLTVQQGSTTPLLMGQSVLLVHHVDKAKYAPYGYFGKLDADDFSLPENNQKYVDSFANTFRLMRGEEPGLSIAIPHPKEEITPTEIIKSVIKHYFFPILSGELSVTVCDQSAGQEINADSIDLMARNQSSNFASIMLPLLELARWAIAEGRGQASVLKNPGEKATPGWTDDLFDLELRRDLQEKLRAGKRLAIKVPIWVRPKRGMSQDSYFHVFLERNHTNDRQRPSFVREGVTISDAVKEKEAAVRAIVVIDHKPLAALLGDAENPAHTEWQERSPKFKDKYEKGPSCLRFLKKSITEIVRILTTADETIDPKPVSDIFFVPKPPENHDKSKEKDNSESAEDGDGELDLDEIETDSRPILLQRIDGGFRVYASTKAKSLPETIAILVAYDVRRGNPFARYQDADFRLDYSPTVIELAGGEVVSSENNHLRVRVIDNSFELKVTGFDLARDLRVKVTPTELKNDQEVQLHEAEKDSTQQHIDPTFATESTAPEV